VIEATAALLLQVAKLDRVSQLLAAFKVQAQRSGGGDKSFRPLAQAMEADGPDNSHRIAAVSLLNHLLSKALLEERFTIVLQLLRFGFLPRYVEVRDDDTLDMMAVLGLDLFEQAIESVFAQHWAGAQQDNLCLKPTASSVRHSFSLSLSLSLSVSLSLSRNRVSAYCLLGVLVFLWNAIRSLRRRRSLPSRSSCRTTSARSSICPTRRAPRSVW